MHEKICVRARVCVLSGGGVQSKLRYENFRSHGSKNDAARVNITKNIV